MFYKMMYGIACYAYANGLRPLVRKVIDDPDSDWDELAISVLDRIFNFNE